MNLLGREPAQWLALVSAGLILFSGAALRTQVVAPVPTAAVDQRAA